MVHISQMVHRANKKVYIEQIRINYKVFIGLHIEYYN